MSESKAKGDSTQHRINRLPRDKEGNVVPRFVRWVAGNPEPRLYDGGHMQKCVKLCACWICGDGVYAHKTFVLGAGAVLNRMTDHPPCHTGCAEWAAKTDLAMAGRPDALVLLWTTKSYELGQSPVGTLFRVGKPVQAIWYLDRRLATRDEVQAGLEAAYAALEPSAIGQGNDGVTQLKTRYADTMATLLPEACFATG